MRDIANEEDVELFIRSFYGKALHDERLAPFFKHMDFENHVPKMIHFWAFVLLDRGGYKTDVTQLHLNMPIKKEHFDIWIELFNGTIDSLFEGEKAKAAKERAFVMRSTIESKINS
ncbi:MAG: group III truncated hemoglobin [Crocinitomicaceae bacterium]|nr:group III truncated hemoglobin [Crocinitomicaceae bacterium]